MVRHYQRVVDEAAKHHLMLDVHEPIKPTGLRRTYPNLMSGEGARGQEYNAWSDDGGNPPEHDTILPFTRFLAGPMDFTPGIFKLVYHEDRPKNQVNTTLAKQLALYVVFYSPLQMVPDLPENYDAHPDAFKFIRDVPTDWEDTRVLNARIGDYVTTVRKQRDGDDWYLGSVTDETGRTLEAPLTFLDPGRTYRRRNLSRRRQRRLENQSRSLHDREPHRGCKYRFVAAIGSGRRPGDPLPSDKAVASHPAPPAIAYNDRWNDRLRCARRMTPVLIDRVEFELLRPGRESSRRRPRQTQKLVCIASRLRRKK